MSCALQKNIKDMYSAAKKAGRTNVHYVEVDDNEHEGALKSPEIQCAVHAFWDTYNDSHSSEIVTEKCKRWFKETSQPNPR